LSAPFTLAQFLQHSTEQVEAGFTRIFPDHWPVQQRLREAMEYSLYAGGKRIRPALMFAAVESLGEPQESAIAAACAIEMIHTYSLIHDDLPAMDNDDMRRGKPTNHVIYGDAMAILAGDGLLTHAFYVLTTAATNGKVSTEATLSAVAELAKFAGIGGMVSGQAADMMGEQGVTSLEQLIAIHREKTGALIACSLRIGGLLGGANEQQLFALEQFGYKIGLAFQIQDDVLDLTSTTEKLGKPQKSDEKSQKVTYPFFLGIDGSRREMKRLTEEAKQLVLQAGFVSPQRLLEIADYLINRDF
jgi:geranylgeranyl diphosphate synthase type II